ncbi:DUF4405 domain-containing protein [Pararhizobium sp. LjRoot238]|uniref:DUF4405 domain-containing protein n=1 Tax=Pararhizobium sp. LjRoot238 TaxID=3342293 RepID=UPI003ECF1E9E
MSNVFRVRLLLDFMAVALLITCLAYWWLDNLSHELFGTALLTLVVVHNVFNRRWYGSVAKARFDVVRIVNILIIVGLALGMTILLVTSFLISRDLFAFMALDGGFAVREIHMFAGYWVILIIALHLGARWTVVMSVFRGMLGMTDRNPARTITLRGAVAVIAVWGVRSSFEMAFGAKLMLTYSLDMWDFNASTLGFFVNYASIVGLYAAVTHYVLGVVRLRIRAFGAV